jgi:hydroxymethylbilane synthase
MNDPAVLRLGTRGSLLARTQSEGIAQDLRRLHPGSRVELVIIKTSGDRLIDRSLADSGGKGLFTKELELALLAGEIDLAVHSMKDVPVTMPLVDTDDLIITAVPRREDARDVLVGARGKPLSANMKIGTGSFRRRCQLLQACPGLIVEPLRGNVDTRLEKVRAGAMDAIVLAMAGLLRLGKFDPAWMKPLDTAVMLPAAGQGALALQCKRADARVRHLLEAIDDADTAAATTAERAVVARLNGDCHSPIAAYAAFSADQVTIEAAVGGRDGNPPVIRAKARASRAEIGQAVRMVCDDLLSQGAEALLAGDQ